MNIFVLDRDPHIAAQMAVDKHIVKMILETGQLLSTAHRVLDGTPTAVTWEDGKKRRNRHLLLPDSRENSLMFAAMPNHPSNVWTRQTSCNYDWLLSYFESLLQEYTRRYSKKHSLVTKQAADRPWRKMEGSCPSFFETVSRLPVNIPRLPRTEFSLAMPEDARIPGNPVASYRNYYSLYKRRFATWRKPSEVPFWWEHPVREEPHRWVSL